MSVINKISIYSLSILPTCFDHIWSSSGIKIFKMLCCERWADMHSSKVKHTYLILISLEFYFMKLEK
jgi:hypothetical protein